ncbi:MAG: four helix bundle protein, partial [Gemmatimonadales bacterium]
MQPYHRLDAWRGAHAFALAVFRATEVWPAKERYGLVSQVRRASFSVPANLVEGQARLGAREFRRFLNIAWASLAEAGYALEFARDLGYLSPEIYLQLEQLRGEAGRPLFGLMRSMQHTPR